MLCYENVVGSYVLHLYDPTQIMTFECGQPCQATSRLTKYLLLYLADKLTL